MKRIDAIFYWLGGVVVPSIEDAAAAALAAQPPSRVDAKVRRALREPALRLTLGRIDGLEFCREAIGLSGAVIGADELSAAMGAQGTIRPELARVILAAAEKCQQWLVCDYPPKWLEAIGARDALWELFDRDRCLRIAGCGLDRLVPDVFDRLASEARLPMDRCVLIDADSPRAVAAVRHGLMSTVYVDGRRLIRDYELRGIFEPPAR